MVGVASKRQDFSTLEVSDEDYRLKQGSYAEVVPPSMSQGGYGYYDPPATEQNMFATSGAQLRPPSSHHTYSLYPEVAPPVEPVSSSKKTTICGIPRKYFWISLTAALLVISAVIIGVAVASTSKHVSVSKDKGSDSGNEDTKGSGGNTSGNGGSTNGSDGGNQSHGNNGTATLSLYENTQLASANFTDAFGNENSLLIYQLSDASIGMSAFNSSHNQWVASTIVNGSISGVKLGTSLAINTVWEGSNTPDVSIYFQSSGPVAMIRSMTYSSQDDLSTTSAISANTWTPFDAASQYNSIPGSALVSYGRQCEFCNQFSYFVWQGPQNLYIGELEGDKVSMERIEVSVTPSANTSVSLTYSGTLSGDEDAILRRSMDLFYRSTTSGLTQLRIGNGAYLPRYVGRDIGPRTSFAAFSTGFNETDPRTTAAPPLGFHVLSIDPDAGDGVQLTYMKDDEWTAAVDEVKGLADCEPRFTMTVTTARRLYCVVESQGGVEIVEWAWRGDPSDTSTYLNWDRIGAVDVGV